MGITESFLVNTSTFDPIIEALIKKGEVPAKVDDQLFAEMGFENPSDLLVIHILKGLKILEGDGSTTELYAKMVDPKTSRQAIAKGVIIGYKDMIKDNPHIYKADLEDIQQELGNIFKGKKTDLIIKYMSNTFQKLVSYAGLNNLDDARIEMLSGENATADIIKDVSEIHKNGTSPSNKISELRKEEKGDKGVDEILNSPVADTDEENEEDLKATVEVEEEAEAKAEQEAETEIQPSKANLEKTVADEETTEEEATSSAAEEVIEEEQEIEMEVEEHAKKSEVESETVQNRDEAEVEEEVAVDDTVSEEEEEEDNPEDLTLTFEGLVGLDEDEDEDEDEKETEVNFHQNGKADKVLDEHEDAETDDSDEKADSDSKKETQTRELEAQLEEIQKDEARRNGSQSAASNKKSEPSMELTKQLTGKVKVQQAYLKKVDLLYKLERHEELLPTLEDIIKHFDKSKDATLKEAVSKAVIRRAVILGKLKRHDELVPALDEIIERFNDSDNREYYEQASMAMLNKAQILENRDADEELLPLYDDIVERLEDTTNPKIREKVDKVFQKRVDLLMETGDNERLLPAVDELINRFKDDKDAAGKLEEAMFKKAEILEQMDRDEDALEAYSEFLEKFGNKIEA